MKDANQYQLDPDFYCPYAPCVGESDICGEYMAGCQGGKQ